MAYQVLSRKWRPHKFQEVVGQEHVTRSLQNAIKNDRVGHAYILTGTRGIGKTSVARLFAKSLRCLDRLEDGNSCGECKACVEFDSGSSMNVFEIDGASNNSVDNIRELINNVQTLPTFGNYKVYIIDEVHMLSTSAFNALLKTLEEPPSHIVFLLATTEPHKLLNTVLSRCQRFDFRNASEETLAMHIRSIAEKEGITFESEQLIDILASQGNGSFRDTLSLFDQVLSFSEGTLIDEATLSMALGLAAVSSVRNLCGSILKYDAAGVSKCFREMIFENVSVENISRAVLDYFYRIIQKIDHLGELGFDEEIIEVVRRMTIDEVFWVYESLSRDLAWGIDSLTPQKTVEIILQKHAKRNDILRGTGVAVGDIVTTASSVEVKKKVETEASQLQEIQTKEAEKVEAVEKPAQVQEPEPEPTPEPEKVKPNFSELAQHLDAPTGPAEEKAPEETEEPVAPVAKKITATGTTWEAFEIHLREIVPAIYTELEQGNIVSELKLSSEIAQIAYGFAGDSRLFYEHFQNGEAKEKIEMLMRDFFQVPTAEVEVRWVDEEEAQTNQFVSKSDIRNQERLDMLEQQRQEIKAHPVVKEAERLFNVKIDKINLNEE